MTDRPILIPDLARAYHCPHHIAVRLFHRESAAYRCIHRLGPMRVYWKNSVGWMLAGQPVLTEMLALIQKGWEANQGIRT